jgi:hypothetical protein
MLRTLSLILATTLALLAFPTSAVQPSPAPAITAAPDHPPGNRWDAIHTLAKQITAEAATTASDTPHRADPDHAALPMSWHLHAVLGRADPGDGGEEETADQAEIPPVALGPPDPGSTQ